MKSGWRQDGGGVKMSCMQIISSYTVTEKQSVMERRHGSPQAILFFLFLNSPTQLLSPMCFIESHQNDDGGRKGAGRGGSNRSAVQENACGCVASSSPSVTLFKLILCR